MKLRLLAAFAVSLLLTGCVAYPYGAAPYAAAPFPDLAYGEPYGPWGYGGSWAYGIGGWDPHAFAYHGPDGHWEHHDDGHWDQHYAGPGQHDFGHAPFAQAHGGPPGGFHPSPGGFHPSPGGFHGPAAHAGSPPPGANPHG